MKISIPEPCSEDWSKMTPTEQGAFCQKCALEVTDFTNKSSLQIKEILTQKMDSKQRICGHIENRQLIEFNNGYIPWKSNQESFRAIWVFSLVAVFGMTLFSCQSTFSKEVVEQMNVSSQEMILDESDTLDIAQLKDSILEMKASDSLTAITTPWTWEIKPYDITGGPIITQGGFGLDFPVGDFEITTCVYLRGDILISGWTLVEPYPTDDDPKDEIYAYINRVSPVSATPVPNTPSHQSPNTHDRPQQKTPRINAKLEKGKPEFDAYISPIPIDETSSLFVAIPEAGLLILSIWELNSLSKIHSENVDLVFGNHTIDINFQDFPKGKYAAQLIWEEEKVVLPFEILEKEGNKII